MGGGRRSCCPLCGSVVGMREGRPRLPDLATDLRERRPTGRGSQLQIQVARAKHEASKEGRGFGFVERDAGTLFGWPPSPPRERHGNERPGTKRCRQSRVLRSANPSWYSLTETRKC
ncbi:hypothetical protein ACQJBY_040933 [Aegilops geniculata]